MTSVKASHRISVLGKEITVKSAASSEHVREVEALVNRTIAEAQASVPVVGDPNVPVIIALMNLAESCLSLSRELDECKHSGNAGIQHLIQRIDNTLP
ncbi:cell division protein ZapA [Geobacter benzoatilyticus]|uniref:Cell division protein ZapA n=1 Tax=Geobacter benzoatilyticus TaxID=2815309 RepID=A0ABX7Q2K8_9BACT|nr:cell division protein ZapA [Geobacter benzoatilyticus]